MSHGSDRSERRGETRLGADSLRISWWRPEEPLAHGGWVTDTSRSGLAFVTATRDLPSPGEEIEVTLNTQSHHPKTRLTKVVRAQPHDAYFSIVACCNVLYQDAERE